MDFTSEIISLAICIATFFIGRMTAKKKEGIMAGVTETDIKWIIKTLQEIKDDNSKSNDKVIELEVRLSNVEKSTSSAHKRLDNIEAPYVN